MNKKLIIFNWKSNPHNAASAIKLARATERCSKSAKAEIVVAPPFTFLEDVGRVIKKTKLGAQDVFWQNVGPYTGEISWHQEKHLKVKYVIVGHSERRRILGETDETISKKVLAALKAGLKVILCVGEPERRGKGKEEREKTAKNYIKKQLQKDLKNLSSIRFSPSSLIIAYEPVWAIGAGRSDTPQDAYDMIQFIKEILIKKYKMRSPKVVYGGSVNSKNIQNFIKYLIDGVLVGGASINLREVKKIINHAK